MDHISPFITDVLDFFRKQPLSLGILEGTALFVFSAYVFQNTALFHRGASGYGSCTTALQIVDGLSEEEKKKLKTKTAIITGANSGIGYETAYALAALGMKVVTPCRTQEKFEVLKKELSERLKKERNQDALIEGGILDLTSLDSVRSFAKTYLNKNPNDQLQLLINNAGIMALPERTETKFGVESQVGVCHIAHFALTEELLPSLKKEKGRVVNVSSIANMRADAKFIESEKLESDNYDPWVAYGNAKWSNIMFSRCLNDQNEKENGVTAYSLHPGGIHTNLQVHVDWKKALFWAIVTPFFFKTTQQGAATSIFCALSSKAAAGAYHSDCNVAKPNLPQLLEDESAKKKFWETSKKLAALTDKQ